MYIKIYLISPWTFRKTIKDKWRRHGFWHDLITWRWWRCQWCVGGGAETAWTWWWWRSLWWDSESILKLHSPSSLPLPFVMTTSKLVSCRINVFNFLLKDSLVWQFVGPPAKHQQHGRGRMIAADHALLMTLLEQIKLWVINLDTESMRAIGFIKISLTSEAFIHHKATLPLKWLIMKCHS